MWALADFQNFVSGGHYRLPYDPRIELAFTTVQVKYHRTVMTFDGMYQFGCKVKD
jgi:hypothetical protein